MLLVAHPRLRDPNFRRTVLYLSAHDPEAGAFGLILNRPLEKVASDFLRGDDPPSILADTPVYLGGPVGQDQLTFAQLGWREGEDEICLHTNLAMEDVALRLSTQGGEVRAFVGYSGWSAGQLEAELSQEAWLVVKPDLASFVAGHHKTLWTRIMNSLGPEFKLLAALPDNPGLN